MFKSKETIWAAHVGDSPMRLIEPSLFRIFKNKLSNAECFRFVMKFCGRWSGMFAVNSTLCSISFEFSCDTISLEITLLKIIYLHIF